jgi:tricarballylate dehydrogenase
MRCAHGAVIKGLTGPYMEEEFFDDLLRVTGGNTDEPLARQMIHKSKTMLTGMPSRACASSPRSVVR